MRIHNDTDPTKIPLDKDAFPNYTIEMWRGNAPCGKGHRYIRDDGSVVDSCRWETRFGGGESVDGIIRYASFSLNGKVNIFVCGDTVAVMDIRYSGKSDFWQWSNDPDYLTQGIRHDLEEDKLIEYLTSDVDDCLFWEMIKDRTMPVLDKLIYR